MRVHPSFLGTLLTVTSLSATAAATDLYVAPGGRSGNNGTSASPLDRITTALSRARPGDRVLVRAGTYPGGGWISATGTAAQPITVLSIDGPRRAIIEGGEESLRIGEGAAYLVFDGLEIRQSGNNTIHIDGGAHHLWLRNVYAHHAGQDGDVVKVNQARSIYLEASEFAFPGARSGSENPSQECIDFVDVDDIVVRDSYVHDGGNSLMYAKGGSRGVVFERNVVANQRAGAIDPMIGLGAVTDESLLGGEDFEAIDVVFRNNIVIGGVSGAIGVYDASNVAIANNLFLNNTGGYVEFRAGSGPAERSERVAVVNNLFVDTRGRMPVTFRRSDHGLNAFTTSHNLFWNNGGAAPSSPLVNLASQPGHLVADPGIRMPATLGDRAAIVAALIPAMGGPASSSGLNAAVAPYLTVDDIRGIARNGRNDRGPWFLGAVPPPTMATDAGVVTPRDAGAAPGDAGTVTPPRDAGTGTPPRDAGTTTTPRDAGGDAGLDDKETPQPVTPDVDGDPQPDSTGGLHGEIQCSARPGAAGGSWGLLVAGVAAAAIRRRRRGG